MQAFRLKKGWAGLEECAKAGGWDNAQQFANEAQLSRGTVEQMYWLDNADDCIEVTLSQEEVVIFTSMTIIGDRHGNRFFNVSGQGFLSKEGSIYISEETFVDVFC